MTDDNLTPDDAMGDNFERSEAQIGKDARDLIRRYDRLLDRHDKVLTEIHQVIIEFGRKLQAGRDMYGPGLEFGRWVQRRRLDTSKLGRDQPERTACMKIAQLHDTGPDYDDEEDDDGSRTPARLDLTDCKNTTPTDIMKWARKHQPHLFPHLRPRTAAPQARKPRRENESPLGHAFNDPLPELTLADHVNALLSAEPAELAALDLAGLIDKLTKAKQAGVITGEQPNADDPAFPPGLDWRKREGLDGHLVVLGQNNYASRFKYDKHGRFTGHAVEHLAADGTATHLGFATGLDGVERLVRAHADRA